MKGIEENNMKGLPMHRAEQLLNAWHGNGGRRSLYSLCKELKIDINLAYVILASDPAVIRGKLKSGKKIHYYKDPDHPDFSN